MMVHSSNENQNARYILPESNRESEAKRDPHTFWTWTCHKCILASGMTAKNNPKCPECDHPRCEQCELEGHTIENEGFAKPPTSSHASIGTTLQGEITLKVQESFSTRTFMPSKVQEATSSQPRKRAPLSSRNIGSKAPKKSKPKSQPVSEQHYLFACPFHKKDPEKYNQYINPDYFHCTKQGWPEMKNLVK